MTAATPTPVLRHPISGEVYRLILPNTAGAPRLARDFAASLLVLNRHAGLVDDARICVTELVTNADRHTRTPLIRVEAAVNRRQVTFTVTDEGGPLTGTLGALRAGPEQEHGRGLALIESLASAWGTEAGGPQHPGRKGVWFTLGDQGRSR
ncbi:ATP-binding protein [Streptomyces californicus]|uniref:ATP-binding protein n=1 Tax=Streptomyces californicus TaxID=67351 RepID=UPI0036B5F105